MTAQEQLLTLTNGLLEGTRQGRISWSETAEEDSFRAVLNNGIVRIEKYPDPRLLAGAGAVAVTTGVPFNLPQTYKTYDQEVYTLVVLDDRIRELARFIPDTDSDARTLHDLWGLACRGARQADQKLDVILKEIDNRIGQR
jgi:hypothetical protein